MKHIFLVATLLSLFLSSSAAQQQPQGLDVRIKLQLGDLIMANHQLAIEVDQLRAQLATAVKEAKDLRDKYEPKEPKP